MRLLRPEAIAAKIESWVGDTALYPPLKCIWRAYIRLLDNLSARIKHWKFLYSRRKSNHTIILFLHIFKTGGTTFNEHVLQHYPEHLRFLCPNRYYRNKVPRFIPKDISPYEIVNGPFEFGIDKHTKRKTQYITVLREPVERVLSLYNWSEPLKQNVLLQDIGAVGESEVLKLEENRHSGYIDNILELDNGMVRALSGVGYDVGFGKIDEQIYEAALQNLEKCYFFGLTEDYDTFIRMFNHHYNKDLDVSLKENVGVGKRLPSDLSDEERAAIEALNTFDRKLYNHALNVYKKQSYFS